MEIDQSWCCLFEAHGLVAKEEYMQMKYKEKKNAKYCIKEIVVCLGQSFNKEFIFTQSIPTQQTYMLYSVSTTQASQSLV